MTPRDALVEILRRRSLTRGEFTLSSGKTSSYYIDARLTTMSAEGLALVGECGLAALHAAGWYPEAVGGLTMGADPVAYAIALASRQQPPVVDAFSVRKTAKAHGAKRRIEGNFRPGGRIVLVEDVITTGGSALEALEAVRAEQAEVLGVLAVVDRGEGGRERLEEQGLRVVAITTSIELLNE